MTKSISFSRYNLHKRCPLKYKLATIDKIPEPPSKAILEGRRKHKVAETYVSCSIPTDPVPNELIRFEDEFRRLRGLYESAPKAVLIESKFGFTKTWGKAVYTDYTNCYARVIVDFCYMDGDKAFLIDYKSGKFREDDVDEYREQLQLYALSVFLTYVEINEVDARLWYLDLGIMWPEDGGLIFERKDVDRLKNCWNERFRVVDSDTEFKPRLNKYCNWCHYRKSNLEKGGGQCPFDI